MASIVSRIVQRVRAEGLLGTLHFAKRWALYKSHYYLYDKSFERLEPVPTSRGVRASDLDYDEELRRHSIEYLAAPRLLVHRAIKLIPGALDRLTFVDIGSGLGRPMLVASEYPFKEVVGYELSPSLHRGAVANIERHSESTGIPIKARSIHGNALEVEWPEGPCVFFLFNPFDEEFMARFLDRINSRTHHGVNDYLVLLNFKHEKLMRRYSFRRQTIGLLERAFWSVLSPYRIALYAHGPNPWGH